MATEENHDSFQSGRLVSLPETSLEPPFSVTMHHDFQRSRPVGGGGGGGGGINLFLREPKLSRE